MRVIHIRIYTSVVVLALGTVLTIGITTWGARLVAVTALIAAASILGMSFLEDDEVWTEEERAERLNENKK